jgi:hypothetical protein
VDESWRARRSRSSTRADSRSICAVSSPISRHASASRTASSAAGRADSSSADGIPGTAGTHGNDHHSGQLINNPPRQVASHPLSATTPSPATGRKHTRRSTYVNSYVQAAALARRIGTNLNQAVARLNSTGRPGADLLPAARLCQRVIARMNQAAEQVRRSIP